MTTGRQGLWAFFDDETDGGMDTHCISCGHPFEGEGDRCPTCQHIYANMDEFIREFDSEPVIDVSDAFEEGE